MAPSLTAFTAEQLLRLLALTYSTYRAGDRAAGGLASVHAVNGRAASRLTILVAGDITFNASAPAVGLAGDSFEISPTAAHQGPGGDLSVVLKGRPLAVAVACGGGGGGAGPPGGGGGWRLPRFDLDGLLPHLAALVPSSTISPMGGESSSSSGSDDGRPHLTLVLEGLEVLGASSSSLLRRLEAAPAAPGIGSWSSLEAAGSGARSAHPESQPTSASAEEPQKPLLVVLRRCLLDLPSCEAAEELLSPPPPPGGRGAAATSDTARAAVMVLEAQAKAKAEEGHGGELPPEPAGAVARELGEWCDEDVAAFAARWSGGAEEHSQQLGGGSGSGGPAAASSASTNGGGSDGGNAAADEAGSGGLGAALRTFESAAAATGKATAARGAIDTTSRGATASRPPSFIEALRQQQQQ
ncbi:hypothetical protein GPECTOR_14g272 [Gonium pectorale]|uniref:Uncharacterized protein n=1 Tax=Gonium pectorale TaxID=33097 RepID=A0A150GMH0_GONPE|nr:hypothetical protein GPECTOR_14g272 [Gonium pectorale]|eukprot:KXZ51033.1 hypothetical protein GPECTOR_14g272 [Gonium pectorale]